MVVTLSINCPADMTINACPSTPGYGTPNGIVNNDDFFYYIARYAAASVLECDLTTTGATQPGSPNYRLPDGTLDADDFGVYLQLLAQGC